MFLTKLLETEVADKDGSALVFPSALCYLTLDRYGHLFPDDLDAVATAFDAAARAAAY
jgi:hypothetical protein